MRNSNSTTRTDARVKDGMFVDLITADINGQFVGKRILYNKDMFDNSHFWFPPSVYFQQITGILDTDADIPAGDPDYPTVIRKDRLKPVTWAGAEIEMSQRKATPTRWQATFDVLAQDGAPYFANPRTVLEGVLAKYDADNLEPIIGFELEFNLLHPELHSDESLGNDTLYSMNSLDEQERFMQLVTEATNAQGIAICGFVAENGAFQYEINTKHNDALTACLDTLLLRRIVKGAAGACEKKATFMAKPFSQASGNGMHIHISIRNKKTGKNIFTSQARLHAAVAGAMASVDDGLLFYVPFHNSTMRFEPKQHVALENSWGDDDRTTAIRLPTTNRDNKRLEFRLAGADANPYLVAASVLAGIHRSLSKKRPPSDATARDKINAGNESLADKTMIHLIDELNRNRLYDGYIAEAFLNLYQDVKRKEYRHFLTSIGNVQRAYFTRFL